MLNIGRMAPGRADYYLAVVADGVEDYYLAAGEEPGRWLGRGAQTLGLDGRVEAEQLRAVLAGADPDTGSQLAAHPARKVPGFDLTFRAPKSVSLLWALSDRDTTAAVAAAHDAAVDAAVGYLERAAGFTRRGAGGTEHVPVDGFVAAAFRHRTSRANDPLLHTHVLVANLAETVDDGVWRTLDSRRLYLHARTAGFLYQAQLRQELTVRLGVAWEPVVNGHADIDGVDRDLIEQFSRRRAAIVEQLVDRGESSARAAQVATLATRPAKDSRRSEAELRGYWSRRAATLGVDDSWHRRLIGRASWQPPELGTIYRDLVVDEALTEQASTFCRRDVVRAVAERLPGGAPATYIEQAADAVIAHDPDRVIAVGASRGQLTSLEVIRREDGRIVPAASDEQRYTTRGLLLTEQRAVNRALERLHERLAVVEPTAVDRAVRRRTLTGEQASMVDRLTGSGHGVEVVVGKAGTGKTYALDAARDAWQTAGIRVTGVALAARAGLELQESASIPSTTLARLLRQLDDGHAGSPLQPGSVLVVDEAAMVGTRQLAKLLDHAHDQQVKVVLVGDPHQLPEIDAGGLFRTLASRLPSIELADNRRQQHRWEQTALDELRHGDPTVAITAYQEHGRIITADTAEALREQLVTDWWEAHDEVGEQAMMVALRRADADDLNHRARSRMLAAGKLTGPALAIDDTQFQAGDRVVCLRNSRRHGVVNGTRATITRIDRHGRQIHAACHDGRPVTLDAGYLDAGHLAHGYAITGHKAQGVTVDHTFVLGSPELYREWGYVALSRGRHTNQLYLASVDPLDELHPYTLQPEPDGTAALRSRLQRSRGHEPLTDPLADIAERWRHLHTRLHAPDIARQRALSQRRIAVARERQDVIDQLARLRQRIIAVGSGLGRIANRRLLTTLRQDHDERARQLTRIDDQLRNVDTELAFLPTGRQIADLEARHHDHTRQLQEAATHRVAGFQHRCPGYLTAALGQPPSDRRGRERWMRTAVDIEAYRLRWAITDPRLAVGDVPDHARQRLDHQRVSRSIERFHEQLRRSVTAVRVPQRGISR